MKKTDRRAIVHEIEMHEDAMIEGMQKNFELELKEGRRHEEQIMNEMRMREEQGRRREEEMM
eukprot:11237200-Ditylum_brightwellii.AAC.1